jgi:transketolase
MWQRYDAYGWHTQTVDDVNNLDAVFAAIEAAKDVTDKPSLIKVRERVLGDWLACACKGF